MRYWTNLERRRAIELRNDGYSYGSIAVLLGRRSADAVAAHLRALRIRNENGISPERSGPRSEISEARPSQHS